MSFTHCIHLLIVVCCTLHACSVNFVFDLMLPWFSSISILSSCPPNGMVTESRPKSFSNPSTALGDQLQSASESEPESESDADAVPKTTAQTQTPSSEERERPVPRIPVERLALPSSSDSENERKTKGKKKKFSVHRVNPGWPFCT